MFYRMLAAAAALTLFVGSTAMAKDVVENTHDGKVVSVTNVKIVMADKDGKEHSHALNSDSKICLDGKPTTYDTLKEGMSIRVTIKDDKGVAGRVEALKSNKDFSVTQDGKVVSINDDKLIMTNKDGKEFTSTLARDGKLTIDGKVARFVDLKPGTRVRVTVLGDGKQLTNYVEAIINNADFEKRS
jgi:CTP-dependent riboflavin kinase